MDSALAPPAYEVPANVFDRALAPHPRRPSLVAKTIFYATAGLFIGVGGGLPAARVWFGAPAPEPTAARFETPATRAPIPLPPIAAVVDREPPVSLVTDVRPAVAPGRLVVHSHPKGALVTIDGRRLGQTPVVERGLAPWHLRRAHRTPGPRASSRACHHWRRLRLCGRSTSSSRQGSIPPQARLRPAHSARSMYTRGRAAPASTWTVVWSAPRHFCGPMSSLANIGHTGTRRLSLGNEQRARGRGKNRGADDNAARDSIRAQVRRVHRARPFDSAHSGSPRATSRGDRSQERAIAGHRFQFEPPDRH